MASGSVTAACQEGTPSGTLTRCASLTALILRVRAIRSHPDERGVLADARLADLTLVALPAGMDRHLNDAIADFVARDVRTGRSDRAGVLVPHHVWGLHPLDAVHLQVGVDATSADTSVLDVDGDISNHIPKSGISLQSATTIHI